MNSRVFCLLPVLSLLSLALASTGIADDWPHWMGTTNDDVWHETGIIDEFPESGAKVVWRQPIGGGYGGPSVVGDHVFVMERTKDEGKGIDVENNIGKAGEIAGGERIKCLSFKSGETVWEYSYKSAYKIAYPNGPRCTPTVDGAYVYCVGAMGHLICLGAKDGELKWKKDLTNEYNTKPPLWGYSSHPIVVNDMLIIPVGGQGSGVVAFNKTTGEEIWKAVDTFDIAYAPLVVYGSDSSSPRQLIFWHAEGVTSLDLENGEEFWFVKFPEIRSPSQTSIATPVIAGNHLLISEFYKGSLLLELSNDPPTAKELWRSNVEDPRNQKSLNAMMATPFVKDGHAFGIGFNGRGQGEFRCVELQSKEMKWSRNDWMSEKPTMFATAFGVENRDRFFLFTDVGELLIAKLSPEGFEELSRAKILEPTTPARGRKVVWCHPAFANGHMVVRNDKEIVCVDLRKSEQPK